MASFWVFGQALRRLSRAALYAAVAAVGASDLWADPPRRSQMSVKNKFASDQVDDVSRELAERTLRALREATTPKGRPWRHHQPRSEAKSPALSAATGQPVVEQASAVVDEASELRASEPAPLAVEQRDAEFLSDAAAGWISADHRRQHPRSSRSAKSKSPPPRRTVTSAKVTTARGSVRWADARASDGEAVRPVADWSSPSTVTLRGPAGHFNPLRSIEDPDENRSVKRRGANPLRAR
jgi:hypothetical protein